MKYELLNPPAIFSTPDIASTEDAQLYFDWLQGVKDDRIKILEEAVKSSPGFSNWIASYRPESLEQLNQWFKKVIKGRHITEEELLKETEALQDNFPNVSVDTNIRILTQESVSLSFDVGLYFAQLMKKNIPSLKWEIVREQRNIDYNQPVLKGKSKVKFNFRRIMEVQAIKLLQNKEVNLIRLYNFWKKTIE